MPRKKGRTSTGYSLEERPRASGKPHWRVRVWVDGPISGTRKLQTVGIYASKTDAQREGARAVEQRQRGTLLQPTDMTVSELLDVRLEQEMPKTVRPENQDSRTGSSSSSTSNPPSGPPAYNGSACKRLRRSMARSPTRDNSSLIRKCHLRLSSALRLARRWGWIAQNPCDVATVPKLTYKEPDVWTPVDTAKFLKRSATDSLHPYWALAVETGARTSELLGLSWSDLDGERETLTIGRRAVRLVKGTPILKDGAKTAAGRRTIRLTESMLAALRTHHDRQQRHRTAQLDRQRSHLPDILGEAGQSRPCPALIRPARSSVFSCPGSSLRAAGEGIVYR